MSKQLNKQTTSITTAVAKAINLYYISIDSRKTKRTSGFAEIRLVYNNIYMLFDSVKHSVNKTDTHHCDVSLYNSLILLHVLLDKFNRDSLLLTGRASD